MDEQAFELASGTVYEADDGGIDMKGDLNAARAALKASPYAGERVGLRRRLFHPGDLPAGAQPGQGWLVRLVAERQGRSADVGLADGAQPASQKSIASEIARLAMSEVATSPVGIDYKRIIGLLQGLARYPWNVKLA